MLDGLVAHLKLRNSRRPKLKRISVYLIFFFFKKKKKICCHERSTDIEDCERLK